MSFLEEVWEEREEVHYRTIFGATSSAIYTLSSDNFKQYNCKKIDPTWLTYGVIKSEPTTKRKTWAYVTSGMSNPWESDVCEAYSSLGMEFVLETEEESTWAIEVLHTLMAYNILLSVGYFENLSIFDYGDRVPLSLSSQIKVMLFTYPLNFPHNFLLPSGKVDLIQVVGITRDEADMVKVKKISSKELRLKLIDSIGGLITDKERSSIVE